MDKEIIAPKIDDETKRNMELLEKLENGEINATELNAAVAGDATLTDPVEPLDEDNVLNEALNEEDPIEEDPLQDEPTNSTDNGITKSAKKRMKKNENLLLEKIRNEQLALDNQQKDLYIQQLSQQMQEFKQFKDSLIQQQYTNQTADINTRIQGLEREMIDASQVYDHVKAAEISSKLVSLKVQAEIEKIRSPNQPQSQPQYQQPQQQQGDPLVAMQLQKFVSKPEHTWTNTEFNNSAMPLTQDAKILRDIIEQVSTNRGDGVRGDLRTATFWEIVEEKAMQALPHKYGRMPTQKSPPVGMGANRGSVSQPGRSNDPIDVEVTNLVKSAMANGLKFKDRDEMKVFVRETKKQLQQSSKR